MHDTLPIAVATETSEENAPARAQLPAIEWEFVTPERAEHYLEFNDKNRRLRTDTVEVYAQDLRKGNWLVTGDTAKFDTTGRLIDGQHRLRAILVAKTPAWMLIVRGVDPTVQRVLDTQAKRSAADALRFTGVEKNAHLIAGIARSALVYTDFLENYPSRAHINIKGASHSEIEEWVREHPEVSMAAAMAVQLNKAGGKGLTAWGLAYIKLMAVDPIHAQEFFSSLANFQTEGKGDPRHTLLTQSPINKARGRWAMGEQLVSIITAWNAFRRGEKLTMIKTRVNGKVRDIPAAI